METLQIQRPIYAAMLQHVQDCYPYEACGFLSGRANVASRIYLIDNVLQSRTAYEMDARQQIEAMLEMEAHHDDLMVIYHSHPQGPQTPSPTDRAQALYDEAVYVIISLQKREQPIVRAFRIAAGHVWEMALVFD